MGLWQTLATEHIVPNDKWLVYNFSLYLAITYDNAVKAPFISFVFVQWHKGADTDHWRKSHSLMKCCQIFPIVEKQHYPSFY